jgi:hypothetical protein
MPSTLTVQRARLASATFYHKPGSPEHEEAARDYYCARLIEHAEEILAKSPPFTQSQREAIIVVVCAGEAAPESTPAP